MLQVGRKALISQFRMTFLYYLSSCMVNLQGDIVTIGGASTNPPRPNQPT